MFCLFFLPHLFPFTLNRIIDNSKKIADLIDDKSYEALSIPLRPPPGDQIIPISHVHDMALMVWMLRHVCHIFFYLHLHILDMFSFIYRGQHFGWRASWKLQTLNNHFGTFLAKDVTEQLDQFYKPCSNVFSVILHKQELFPGSTN